MSPSEILLYIVNPLADSESYIEDKFKIDQLEKLSDLIQLLLI